MRMGKTIWHCKRISPPDSEVRVFDEPKPYTLSFGRLNLQPASGYTSTVLYGERIMERWTLLANSRFFEGVFAEGDLLYIDDAFPNIDDENYVNGDGANAVVDSVREQNLRLRIMLKSV